MNKKPPIPAALKHAETFYNALHERANDEVIENQTVRVFRGSVTRIYKQTNLSLSYYSKIMAILGATESIDMIIRGSRDNESVVVLYRSPLSAVDSNESILKQTKRGIEGLTSASVAAKLTRRISDLEKQIGGMNIPLAFDNLERRIKALEEHG